MTQLPTTSTRARDASALGADQLRKGHEVRVVASHVVHGGHHHGSLSDSASSVGRSVINGIFVNRACHTVDHRRPRELARRATATAMPITATTTHSADVATRANTRQSVGKFVNGRHVQRVEDVEAWQDRGLHRESYTSIGRGPSLGISSITAAPSAAAAVIALGIAPSSPPAAKQPLPPPPLPLHEPKAARRRLLRRRLEVDPVSSVNAVGSASVRVRAKVAALRTARMAVNSMGTARCAAARAGTVAR